MAHRVNKTDVERDEARLQQTAADEATNGHQGIPPDGAQPGDADTRADEREGVVTAMAAAHDFAASRGRPAVLYLLPPGEPIGTPNVRDLSRDFLSHDPAARKEVDLVIDSDGGDIHAAYHLVSFLRDHTERFHACIPRYARSAATLLCIGADSIWLGDLAVLGPLDAQVYIREKGGRPQYSSALIPFKSLERLREFSLETLGQAASFLYERGVDQSEETLRHATEFVRMMTAPMYEKFEAHKVGYYSQALSVGEDYAKRVFERRARPKGRSQEEWERMSAEIARRLVHSYPSHEFVIDRREIERLGFEVHQFTKAVERDAMTVLAERRAPMSRMVMVVDPRKTSKEAWMRAAKELAEKEFKTGSMAREISAQVPGDGSVRIRHQMQERPGNPWQRYSAPELSRWDAELIPSARDASSGARHFVQ